MSKFKIKNTSLMILELLLSYAIQSGSFKVSFSKNDLLRSITELDEKTLELCLGYLFGSDLLVFINWLNSDKSNGVVQLTPKAVDWVESQDNH